MTINKLPKVCSKTKGNLYDSSYYENYNGEAYGRTDHWLTFFGGIADNIVRSLRPQIVMDVGCAYGLLVECLRDRGVDAFGMDISDYAISQARPDIQKYLSAATVLEPIGRKFDLIVTIEVLEHIEEKDCDQAIRVLCDSSDTILISTTPDDFDDPTHFNVNGPLYWIKKFAQFGYRPDIRHDAGYLTPYAMLFRRADGIIEDDVQVLFGDKKLKDLEFSRVQHKANVTQHEIINLKGEHSNNIINLKKEYEIHIEKFREDIDDLNFNIKNLKLDFENKKKVMEEYLKNKDIHIRNLESIINSEKLSRENLESSIKAILNSRSWKITSPLRRLFRFVGVFFPIFPKIVGQSENQSTLSLSSQQFNKWAVFEARVAPQENCLAVMNSDSSSGSMRLSFLPMPRSKTRLIWLARAAPGSTETTFTCIRGNPTQIRAKRVSALFAWILVILDRWRRGRGVLAAVRLGGRILNLLLREGVQGVSTELWQKEHRPSQSYDAWLIRYDASPRHVNVRHVLGALDYQPLISIIVPVFNSNLEYLMQSFDSVRCQSYVNWELCICDDGSTEPEIKKFLLGIKSDRKINVVFHKENGGIAAASNSALDVSSGEFVTFLDHDDLLHEHALAAVVMKLNEDRNIDLIYSDEDKIDEEGNRHDPHFKTDWNPDLLLSQNYICHLAVYRRSLVEFVGNFRGTYNGAQDYDLVLRVTEHAKKIVHLPYILYHWRSIAGSTAMAVTEKNYAHENAKLAVGKAIKRRRLAAKLGSTKLDVYHRIIYELPDPAPLVSVIIPTRDYTEVLKVCIDGLINGTSYENFEVLIMDNDSQEPETLKFFQEVSSDKIKIIKHPGNFSFSAINNHAAKVARGEILLLLNNDIEIIHEDWMRELVSHAVRPEIGAVGARLYYPDDRIQHDGIIIGIGGVAGYAHPGLARSEVGEFGRSALIQNFSAVTAAALAVKKSIYEEVGGLNEENLAVAFNDVDFCLKIQRAGYRNLYTPFAELYHHESASRGPDTAPDKAARFEREALYMKQTWGEQIANDRYYNPNLSLTHTYELDLDRGHKWPWEER